MLEHQQKSFDREQTDTAHRHDKAPPTQTGTCPAAAKNASPEPLIAGALQHQGGAFWRPAPAGHALQADIGRLEESRPLDMA